MGKSRFDTDDVAAQRPNHPDFWALCEIVIYLDGDDEEDSMSSQEGPITPQVRHKFTTLVEDNDRFLRCTCGKEVTTTAGTAWHYYDALERAYADIERLRAVAEELAKALRAWLEHVGPPSGAFGQSMTATMAYTATRDLRAAAAKYLNEQTAEN